MALSLSDLGVRNSASPLWKSFAADCSEPHLGCSSRGWFCWERDHNGQVELVSVILNNTWSVVTARVDSDTTMEDSATKYAEILPLPVKPSAMTYCITHKIVCLKFSSDSSPNKLKTKRTKTSPVAQYPDCYWSLRIHRRQPILQPCQTFAKGWTFAELHIHSAMPKCE